MIEQAIEIDTADGSSDGVLYYSNAGSRLPGILFLTDIGGIRPSQKQMASRLAAEGHTVLMPNVFYRSGRPPMFDFPLNFGDQRTMHRIRELSGPLTPGAFDRDASAYIDFMAILSLRGRWVLWVIVSQAL
jgi:carboxymethylenebutenolidase